MSPHWFWVNLLGTLRTDLLSVIHVLSVFMPEKFSLQFTHPVMSTINRNLYKVNQRVYHQAIKTPAFNNLKIRCPLKHTHKNFLTRQRRGPSQVDIE